MISSSTVIVNDSCEYASTGDWVALGILGLLILCITSVVVAMILADY